MGSKIPEKSDKVCKVCNFEILANHEILILWICRHVFHLDCIDEYYKMFHECPQCREDENKVNSKEEN